jgi:hypothetical protein
MYVHCAHGVDRNGRDDVRLPHGRRRLDQTARRTRRWSNLGAHKLWLDLRNFVKKYTPDKLRTARPDALNGVAPPGAT